MKVSSIKSTIMLLMLCCAVIVTGALMGGCAGSDGAAGAPGANGTNGTNGTNGADATTGTVDASTFTFDDLRNIPLGGKIISASTSSSQPVVTIQVINKSTGEGITGLRTFALHIAQLQPEVSGTNSYWMNYITTASTSTGSFRPAADPVSTFSSSSGALTKQGYSVVDNLDGTYVITFGSNIKSGTTAAYGSSYYNPASATYDANLTHRIVVGVRSVAVPGTVGKTVGAYAGPINPITGSAFAQFTNTNGANFIFDFVPATGAVLTTSARDIVTIAACNECHYKIQYGFPRGNNTSGHFGSRTDTRTCVMCHTPQNVISGQTATTNVDFTPYIHKLHMGEELPVVESNLTGTYEVLYPQDIRNCAKCHNGADGANWKNKPSRKACGSCHNNVNFATGLNHPAPAGLEIQTDDNSCTLCHDADYITYYHTPVTKNTTTTSSSYGVAYAINNNRPANVYNIQYVITSVSVSADRTPSVTFQVKTSATATGTPTAVNFGTYDATTNPNMIPNTTGGPTIAFAYNQTEDGITSPADFNANISVSLGLGNPTVSKAGVYTAPVATASLWSNGGTLTPLDRNGVSTGIQWKLTGPDSSNKYTVSTNVPLPAKTTMLSAAIYGNITQTNLGTYPYAAASISDFVNYSGTSWRLINPGLVIMPQAVIKAYVPADTNDTSFIARRTIVDNAKCNACHDQLGHKQLFHSGTRNDGTYCNFCHTPNSNSKGWSYSFNTFVHAIHAAAKRETAYTFAADFSNVTYPGLLKNCEQCHVSGAYDFTASASSAASSKLLLNTVATGTTSAADANTSPYIAQTAGTVYGSGFAYTASTGTTAEAAGTTLVTSPIAAACFSCHDTSIAMAHMEANGGSIYEARSVALTRVEQCLVCHGPAANTAYGDFVPAIKAVHRWW